MRKCLTCKKPIPAARLEALPDTNHCVAHSTAVKPEGFMDYPHKTGACLVILPNNEEQRRLARNAFRRKR